MVDAPGVVTAVDGLHALVRMDETGCGHCHEPGGCGGQNIGEMFRTQPRLFRVENPDHSRVGDRVVVVTTNDTVNRGALFAYGLPLLALFLGAFAGRFVAGETGSIIGAVVGVLGAWMALPRLEAIARTRARIQPLIRR